MATLLNGLLVRRRKPRYVPDNSGKKINCDHLQRKLQEKTGLVQIDKERINMKRILAEVTKGADYFWKRRGMTAPLPAFAFDPFAADEGKKRYDETRPLKKQA